jgi:3-oxoacyl-[acyl-carrier-protein] synthase II
VNLHATSTPVGDLAELNGMQSVFGDALPKTVLTSTKSQTGHLLGAAGAVESIASILSIRDGVIPPTINMENLDPELPPNLDIVFNQARKQEVRVAMSNTFGFGGHNAILVFGQFKSN